MNMNIAGDKELFHFLGNGPKEFRDGEKIRKYQLKNGDYIHCVLWNMHFYITGTDIVKILVWRFNNAGRQITSPKKFEEGVFSDLRNLKPGIDATLERPRSEFLEFLYKNGCIRTQKKQKVFFWYSVPHDALFCDALDRDLRRETSYYSYSKYMNNFATQGMLDNEFQTPGTSPYGRVIQPFKKKNSVKLATRNKRSPNKDQNMIRPEFKIPTQPTVNISPMQSCNKMMDTQHTYMEYNAFNPNHPDPFCSFGPAYNYNYTDLSFVDEYNAPTIEFGTFEAPLEKKEKETTTYKMPEIFGTPKDESEKDDKDYINGNNGYFPNIPNSQGKQPQK